MQHTHIFTNHLLVHRWCSGQHVRGYNFFCHNCNQILTSETYSTMSIGNSNNLYLLIFLV